VEALEDRAVPAVFNVNSLLDTLAPPAGVVTLRSAIQQANATPGGNTINLTVAGTYRITLAGANEDNNATGDFDILPSGGDLTIANTSGGAVAVDGGGLDRVFDINPVGGTGTPKFTVTMEGFTIQNGLAQPGDGAAGSGGGIRDQGNASLTLDDMVITHNAASADGGGVSMENIVSTPWTLTLANTTISNNRAGDAGGGVETDGSGKVNIINSTITGNISTNQGAGIWLDAIAPGTVTNPVITNGGSGYTSAPTVFFVGGGATEGATGFAVITNGQVTGVVVANGGAGYTSAPVIKFVGGGGSGAAATTTVNNTFLSANLNITGTLINSNIAIAADNFGGGVGNAGNGVVTITSSTISDNFSGGNGGGFADENGVGALVILNSTFVDNSAVNDGGGVFEGSTITTTIQDSTFTGNSTQANGGGIEILNGMLVLNNTIVAGNFAGPMNFVGGTVTALQLTANGSGYKSTPTVQFTNAPGDTTGTGAAATATVVGGQVTELTITNPGTGYTLPPLISFVGGSPAVFATATSMIVGGAPDILATVMTGSGNFIGINDGNLINLPNGTNGNLVGTILAPLNPLLGPLQNNGGPTPTRAPLTGSPVIDAGINTVLPTTDPITGKPLTDQRGFLRIVSARVDIGAVEFQPGTTATTLTLGTTAVNFGKPVTLTAKVAATSPAPNNPTTGTVTFFNGKTVLGTVTLDATGTATLTTAALPPGNLTLTAVYTPDATAQALGYVSSTSAAATLRVFTASTVGVFDPKLATWFLRNENNGGSPDAGQFQFGAPGWIGLVGDWNGDGQTTIAVVDPTTMTWYIRNSNTPGAPDYTPFQFGAPGWVPIAGDWTGSGHTGIGVYDPTTGTFYLRTEVGPGSPDAGKIQFGMPGWKPVVSDWAGLGKTGIGVVDPTTETWYLRNTATGGNPDYTPFQFGAPGWLPVAGDWSASGHAGIGVVDPTTETWFLRNEVNGGSPDAGKFQYGAPGWTPVTGNWEPPGAPQMQLAASEGPGAAPLGNATLHNMVQSALVRLLDAGVSPSVVSFLAAAHYEVGDLPPGTLGETFTTTDTVLVSADAAGNGWFVDPTPLQNEDFDAAGTALPGGPAAGREDLLTVMLHEMGHLAGRPDVSNINPFDLMDETLPVGVRRTEALDKVFAVGL
jgi:hypothetical protein